MRRCVEAGPLQVAFAKLRKSSPPIIDKPPNGDMSDQLEEIQDDVTNDQSSQAQGDEAFCARMRAAIEAGLESAPIGVVTTPGTQTPRYVPAEPRLPASPSGNTNF